MSAPLPNNETERLRALIGYRILDTPAEGEFDGYARLVAQLCETQIGAVTLIDHDRQWLKAVHGPLARSIPRDHAFCPHTILQEDVLEVPDTLLDARFAHSALVVGEPWIRFYAGVALVTRDHAALGTLCVIDIRPSRLNSSQRKLMVIAAAHISAQLELRRAMLQLLEEKKIATELREQLAHANQRQQDLTTMMVHDLKNPITAISLSASWLADETNLTPSQREAAEQLVGASHVLASMVNDLLDVSRAEDGKLMLSRTVPVDLGAVAQACVERSHAIAVERGQRVAVQSPADPVFIAGDPHLMARVVTNLLDNALKYAPPGSSVDLELNADSKHVVLRLIDQGPGIPAAHREAVFEKYFQVEQSNQVRPSHGLGLAFCRLAIEAHHGTIAVEDSPHGCVFRISLPRSTPS